jgi:hypothetical protein
MFAREDLDVVTGCVADAWRSGLDRDWSAPAGTLEWSCTRTADHAVDAVLAVAFFLASRRQDSYPEWWGEQTLGPNPKPEHLVEALESAGRLLSGIVATTDPQVRAIIWRRPAAETRPPIDFAARGAIEMILHGHDVCAGLGVRLAPPTDVCERLREHIQDWPHWSAPGWRPLAMTGDPWTDLLLSSNRRP